MPPIMNQSAFRMSLYDATCEAGMKTQENGPMQHRRAYSADGWDVPAAPGSCA